MTIIYKAQPTGDQAVPSIQLSITEPIPEERDVDAARARFREQGRTLAKMLRDTLPGGTFGELLAALLETQASLFRCTVGEPVYEERARLREALSRIAAGSGRNAELAQRVLAGEDL